jgi:hypothetical protein
MSLFSIAQDCGHYSWIAMKPEDAHALGTPLVVFLLPQHSGL